MMRLATRLGEVCIAYYQSAKDDSWRKVEISKEDYAALALKDAGPPPRPKDMPDEFVWKVAVGGKPVFDTPSGDLEKGDYYPGDNLEGKACSPMAVSLDGKLMLDADAVAFIAVADVKQP